MIVPLGPVDGRAIQSAIDAAVGDGDPTATVRRPTDEVLIPAGTWVLDRPLNVRSVEGFTLRGVPGQTWLYPDGIDTALNLDGVANSTIEGIGFKGSGTVDKVVHLHWGADTVRSVTDVVFDQVRIQDLTYRIGFALGQDNANQVDEVTFNDCRVSGNWQPGNTTTWQYAYRLGNGNAGNLLAHQINGLRVHRLRRGVAAEGTGVTVVGGEITNCEVDFYQSTPHGPITVKGIRSEGAQRLFTNQAQTSTSAQVTFDTVEWHGNKMVDQWWADLRASGSFTFRNVRITNTAVQPPKLRAFKTGAGTVVIFDGLTLEGGQLDSIVGIESARVAVEARGLVATDATGGVIQTAPWAQRWGQPWAKP